MAAKFIVPSEASNSVHLKEFRSNVGYCNDPVNDFPHGAGEHVAG
jgi:hypothetical protein